MPSRSTIPAKLKRTVLIEAGHRCAIPTCRHTTTEIHHIVPYAEVQEHTFDNLIALCPNCHSRCRDDNQPARNNEIDRASVKIYKQKLQYVTDRYSKYELNVMDYLRRGFCAPVNGIFNVKNLVDDELIEIGFVMSTVSYHQKDASGNTVNKISEPADFSVVLTDNGKQFLENWQNAASSKLTYEDT